MTVRAWFTISALVLVALGTAAAVRILSPLKPPELLVSVRDVRLEGVHRESCWPQRSGELRCEDPDDGTPDRVPVLTSEGRMRLIAAYPVQPEGGSIRIVHEERGTVVREPWDDRLDYELEPGRYVLELEARWPGEAFVRYAFPFRTR